MTTAPLPNRLPSSYAMNTEDRHIEIARSLFREANDAFFLFDPRSRMVIDLNPAAQRLTGLQKHEARTMRLEELFDPSGLTRIDALALALTRTDFFHSREGYLLRRKQRDALPVNLSVSRIHTAPETLGLIVVRDVSDRKRSEEALRQVEARYNSLVACTGVVLWETDDQGIHISLSPAFERITGWRRDDWIGRDGDGLFHPDDASAAQAWHERARQGEVPPRFELRVRTKSGDYLNFEYLLVTRIGQGPQGRILSITRDISEQKRIEKRFEQAEAMRRAKEAAEQASRAKSEFLSKVSHELRTPLTAILGFTELLDEHPFHRQGPAEITDYLGTVRENSRVLLALIDDLLDITRIEAGEMSLKRENFSLRQVVTDAVEAVRTKAEAKQLRLESELDASAPDVIATTRPRLQQILVKLLDNAIKFTERGTVMLTVRMINRDQPGSSPTPSLSFDVSDTGMGLAEDELPRLFQPFHRVRSAVPGGAGGTGLGLAICQRLASRLGGDISARSTLGVGSTFTLTLPLGEPAPRDGGAVSGSASSVGTRFRERPVPHAPKLRARILLAEDNEANRQLIGLRLSRAGAQVVSVRNGKEALERIHEEAQRGLPIDAVIMDMEMPVIDGYEAVRRLRSSGFTAPVVAVTAYAMSKDRDECLALGCDDHFSKPIDWDRFFLKLSELLAEPDDVSND
jgi:PAS domain S-box-containing protein